MGSQSLKTIAMGRRLYRSRTLRNSGLGCLLGWAALGWDVGRLVPGISAARVGNIVGRISGRTSEKDMMIHGALLERPFHNKLSFDLKGIFCRSVNTMTKCLHKAKSLCQSEGRSLGTDEQSNFRKRSTNVTKIRSRNVL